jgi:hypothetical protein
MERPDGSLHEEDFNEEVIPTEDPEADAVPDPDEREVGLSPEEEELEPVPDDPADAEA